MFPVIYFVTISPFAEKGLNLTGTICLPGE